MFSTRRFASAACAVVLTPFAALRADILTLQPVADTTLIEIAPDSNLGGGDFFNAGTAGNGNRNRALMVFGLDGMIPMGSVINSVTLSLEVVREPADGAQASLFGLHRVNVSWGEGDKVPEDGSPGLGAPASPGEATWNHRFLTGVPWAAPGGQPGMDFLEAPSSTSFVFGMGDPVVFESSAALVGDVQHWVDNPQLNFGWMLVSGSEDLRKSARSFASSEYGGGGPMLTIDYTVVPEPAPVLLLGGGLVLLGAMAWRRRR